MELWPGKAFPLGAHFDGSGTNFSIASEVADRVELCLFDTANVEKRITLPEVAGNVWHGYLPGVQPGQRYGYRVHGPFHVSGGARCNPNKLLIDPYALAIEGRIHWDPSLYDEHAGQVDAPNPADSAEHMPRSIVVNPYFKWDNDRPPNTPWHETLIYELHPKGFSMLNENVPEKLRGTYSGLGHPASTAYLKELGVTAIELMPVHHFVHDQRLDDLGLKNYWGYNSIGYFAPHEGYARKGPPGSQVQCFKEMVKAMHAAGIEVILDVVYNHTAEGGRGGPTLSFRGLDNETYYRLDPNDKREYIDYTGCGNTMSMRQPFVLQLIMDSLRYWVEEMHVDGFRFDLASALAREHHDVDRLSVFFNLMQQDPILQRVKLIAEPWDIGDGGYQVGNFPPYWSEWNGKYRDTTRDFWRGSDQTLAEFAYRFTGSSDLYETSNRRPHASINFVTCHDGFTLRDLVSYNEKHNLANGEEGRDGDSHNRSWNCGHEGDTDDSEILSLRKRQQRNFLSTLLLSQGVPMILAGDEVGRGQGGNNNPYCQDNEISWVDWAKHDVELHAFVCGLTSLRSEHPVFRRRQWFEGRSIHGHEVHRDIGWFRPSGTRMNDDDWRASYAKALGVFLNGEEIASTDERGCQVVDDSFYVIFNAGGEALTFCMPKELETREWVCVLNTETGHVGAGGARTDTSAIAVCSRSLHVYRCRRTP